MRQTQKKIEEHVVAFYKKLYNQNLTPGTKEETTELLRNIDPLSEEEKNKINVPLTEAVLKATLQSTSDSCPGPDGIPYSYLKATWNWYGPILTQAWEYSVQTKKLPESHKTSWLKLIPKAGKNVKDLKNWRPITLSNCDHKIITKALSRKMAENFENVISGNQTAYMRKRSISDNLRLVVLANKISKRDTEMKGLLIALDAQKAFDSVSHQFIKDSLTKIGLEDFIPIFELLYEDSKVDIMINGKICEGYGIKNGVKQGDALSCVLFILVMEPLIRNMEASNDIGKLKSRKYGIEFPKCIGYADDINVLTTNTANSVKAVIKEYEKFSKVSGLQLNADKTEIFQLENVHTVRNYTFSYKGVRTVVTNTSKIKLNGIDLVSDPDETHRANFERVKEKMSNQFGAWACRGLTLLGKILIYKTFGLSQVIYATRVLAFSDKQNREIRNLVYKFLWNKNFSAQKAPDRIKREYLRTEIREGGFGMVDHEDVTNAMNAKQILINLENRHPIREILNKVLINPQSHFSIRVLENLDEPASNYCKVLNGINRKLLNKDIAYLQQDRLAKDMFLKEDLKLLVRPDRKNAIELTLLRNQGKTRVRDLLPDQAMTNHFRMRLLHFSFSVLMDACLTTPDQDPVNGRFIPIKGKYKMAHQVTSKELRQEYANKNQIDRFKIGITPDSVELILPKIKKLKCVRAKNLALRLLHGDIYTGSRLLKFGLAESDECSKCRQSETLAHLLNDCWYPSIIWSNIVALYKKTDERRQPYDRHTIDFAIGARVSVPKLKLHLEIIRRLTNKERPNILPKTMISQALEHLAICDNDHRKYYHKLRQNL